MPFALRRSIGSPLTIYCSVSYCGAYLGTPQRVSMVIAGVGNVQPTPNVPLFVAPE